MKFDAYTALAKLREGTGGSAIRAICAIQLNLNSTDSTNSTDGSADTENTVVPPNSTNSTGQVIPWPGRGYSCEAINAGVAAAFNEFEAMNDPHDPRAWA